MLWRRFYLSDPGRSEGKWMGHPRRGRWASSRSRRRRPCIECLEGRQLLAVFTEFPLPSSVFSAGPVTTGPDGNLWFGQSLQSGGHFRSIGRITPIGDIVDFPLASATNNGPLTVGPDGNLWF